VGETGLTSEKILRAAEDVVRRHGPDKATVVDVARALGVTHGSVYRYFPSKAALRGAVVRAWLDAMMPPLQVVVAESGPAPGRLRRWLDLLVAAKRKRAAGDPELFAAYSALAVLAGDVVLAHIDEIVGQATRIIADGASRGEFAAEDPARAARSVLIATSRFHHPSHAAEWTEAGIDADLDGVWQLLMSGLGARGSAGASNDPDKQSNQGL